MKRHLFCVLFPLLLLPALGRAQDPLTEIVRQAIIKALKAADLRIQRLQNRTLQLQAAQKRLENTLVRTELRKITDWVERQKEQYRRYFEELATVRAVLHSYGGVRRTLALGDQLLKEVSAVQQLLQQGSFTSGERAFLRQVFSGQWREGQAVLQELKLLLTSGALELSDGARLALLEKAAGRLQRILSDLRQLTAQARVLSAQRRAEQRQLKTEKQWYGLQ